MLFEYVAEPPTISVTPHCAVHKLVKKGGTIFPKFGLKCRSLRPFLWQLMVVICSNDLRRVEKFCNRTPLEYPQSTGTQSLILS